MRLKTEGNLFPQSYTRLKDGIPLLFSWGLACFTYMKGESDTYKLFLLSILEFDKRSIEISNVHRAFISDDH